MPPQKRKNSVGNNGIASFFPATNAAKKLKSNDNIAKPVVTLTKALEANNVQMMRLSKPTETPQESFEDKVKKNVIKEIDDVKEVARKTFSVLRKQNESLAQQNSSLIEKNKFLHEENLKLVGSCKSLNEEVLSLKTMTDSLENRVDEELFRANNLETTLK